jgi:integrase
MKALLNLAVKIDKIPKNVFCEIKPLKTKNIRSKTIQASTLILLNQLFENDYHYSKLGWFYRILLNVLSNTGIRRRQLIGIRWQDIDMTNAQLYLSAEFSKNGNDNLIPINQQLIHDFTLMKDRSGIIRSTDQVFNLTKFSNDYSSNKSNETSETQISGLFTRLSKKIGKSISPHQFRHTFATNIVNNGGNIKTLSEFLSHSDIRTTMIYVQPDMENMRKIQNMAIK